MKAVRHFTNDPMVVGGIQRSGTDSVLTGGFGAQYGSVVATPAVGEKGYLDVRMEITTPGGHSSVPPPHTVSFLRQIMNFRPSKRLTVPFQRPVHRSSLSTAREYRGKPQST